MAIWFPSAKDIKAAKIDLNKDDRVVVHRNGKDYQSPIGDSLDHRYSPLDHGHSEIEANAASIADNASNLQKQAGILNAQGNLIASNTSLIETHNHDEDYSEKGHKHLNSNDPCQGPARYEWKYTTATDPENHQCSVSTDFIRLSITPFKPYAQWNIAVSDREEFTVNTEIALYRYYKNSNAEQHNRYSWQLQGLAKCTKYKYYALSTGKFHRFKVDTWRKSMRSTEVGSGLWVTCSGLLS